MKKWRSFRVVLFLCVCLLRSLCLGFLFYDGISSTRLIHKDLQHRRDADREVDRNLGPSKESSDYEGMRQILKVNIDSYKGQSVLDEDILVSQKQQFTLINDATKVDRPNYFDFLQGREINPQTDSNKHTLHKRSSKKTHNNQNNHKENSNKNNPNNQTLHSLVNEHSGTKQNAQKENTHNGTKNKNKSSQIVVETTTKSHGTHNNKHTENSTQGRSHETTTPSTQSNHTGVHPKVDFVIGAPTRECDAGQQRDWRGICRTLS